MPRSPKRARGPLLKCKCCRRQTCIPVDRFLLRSCGCDPFLPLNEKGSLHGNVTAVPMTKGNKTARRIRCNILLSLLLLPSFHPRGPTNHGRPIKAVKFRPSVSHGTFVPSVYIARRTGREGGDGGRGKEPGGASEALSIRESFPLALLSVCPL